MTHGPSSASQRSHSAGGSTTTRPVSHWVQRISFHLALFAIAFLIVITRRPDALLNAQFFAEDGLVWFSDAYNFGFRCLLMPAFGYLHTLTRLISLLAQVFPFSIAPLIMNLGAITIQIVPVNVILSSRFSEIGFPIRLLASFLYLALPNTHEIDANVSNLQWHLGLLAFLLLVARRPENRGWRIFDGMVLLLISLNGPIGIVIVPFAAILWWTRRHRWQLTILALLIPGAIVQAITLLLHLSERPQAELGAGFVRFFTIIGRQVFFSSLLGMHSQIWIIDVQSAYAIAVVVSVLGLAVLLYTLIYAPVELKLFIAFDSLVFAMCLIRPLVGPAPQWHWLCFPGGGNRYYFLPMTAFVASLLWIASRGARFHASRFCASVLLMLLPIGIYQDWRYPPFLDYHFQGYADRFERASVGTKFTIPINPNWSLELTKHGRILWASDAGQSHQHVPVGIWK